MVPHEIAAQGVVRSVHQDWQMRCEPLPGTKTEQCVLMQSVSAEDRVNIGISVIVLKAADNKHMIVRVVAPLGVLLPMALELRIDQVKSGSTGFVYCEAAGCVAQAVLDVKQDEKLINQLRSGTVATFIVYQTPEEGIGFPISLKGFAEGYDKLP